MLTSYLSVTPHTQGSAPSMQVKDDICFLFNVPQTLCSKVIKSGRMTVDRALCLCTWGGLIYNTFDFQVFLYEG